MRLSLIRNFPQEQCNKENHPLVGLPSRSEPTKKADYFHVPKIGLTPQQFRGILYLFLAHWHAIKIWKKFAPKLEPESNPVPGIDSPNEDFYEPA